MTEPTQDKSFEVYDRVWVMDNNRPAQKVIYSITELMNDCKNGTDKRYAVVNGQIGAGVGNNKEVAISAESAFHTKAALIESLLK